MPSKCYYLNSFFKKIDLFPHNNFLRYNGEAEYTTATGGALSTIIIILFVILFANMGLKTVNKQIITSSVSTNYQENP